MKDFEKKRINKRLERFEGMAEKALFLGVPITELNKSQLEKLVCFQMNTEDKRRIELERRSRVLSSFRN